jgi:hypothetical protein
MMFALIAGVILLPALYTGISNYGDQIRATATALQMAHIQKAAEAYITTNAAAVDANSTASSPAIITVPMLVNTGFLPNGFNSMNPYGQTWQVQVLQPAANQLQALVLGVGGNAITAKQSGMIATTAGDSGGVIGGGSGDFAVPGCSGGEACGAYAGWSVSTAGYQNVAAAHPAALIEYANNQLQSDYLYRVAVPGQPQLNTMQTNLNMGANNINNAQNVNVNQDVTLGNPSAATGGSAGSNPGQLGVDEPAGQGLPSGWGGGIHTWDIYVNGTVATGLNGSQGAYMSDFNGGMYGGGQVGTSSPNNANYAYMQANNGGSSMVTNGTVQGGYVNSTGNVNAQGSVTSQNDVLANNVINANNGVGAGNYFGMYNGSWWANNAGDSSQSGNAYVGGQVTANYDATLGTAGGSANVGWGCGPNGAIAANANGSGQVLACQGGSWQAMGGQWLQSGSPFWQAYDPVGNMTARFCAISGLYVGGGGGGASVNPVSGPNGAGQYVWSFGGDTGDTSYWGACYN